MGAFWLHISASLSFTSLLIADDNCWTLPIRLINSFVFLEKLTYLCSIIKKRHPSHSKIIFSSCPPKSCSHIINDIYFKWIIAQFVKYLTLTKTTAIECIYINKHTYKSILRRRLTKMWWNVMDHTGMAHSTLDRNISWGIFSETIQFHKVVGA